VLVPFILLEFRRLFRDVSAAEGGGDIPKSSFSFSKSIRLQFIIYILNIRCSLSIRKGCFLDRVNATVHIY
jgi:hypothetical protein